jgi:hypothetical protein
LTVGGTSTTVSSGSITNNGTFDMNTTASANVTFAGNMNGMLSGAGAPFDFFSITINKGTTTAPILDVTSVITTAAVSTSTNRLVLTNGTFRLSSASNITPIGGPQTVCAAAGRLWLNNAGAVYNSGFAGSPTVTGELRIDSGTFNYGSGNDTLTFTSGSGILTMTGGTLNMLGAVSFPSNLATQLIMSGGNVTLAGRTQLIPRQDQVVAAHVRVRVMPPALLEQPVGLADRRVDIERERSRPRPCGGCPGPGKERPAHAVELAHERWKDLKIDGEMHADIALDPERRASRFGFAEIKGEANVLIFPNLDSAHIGTRLMGTIGGATVVGPILMGMRSPVNSLQPTATVDDIVNLTAITVLQAQKED